jgi:hypothetical protein
MNRSLVANMMQAAWIALAVVLGSAHALRADEPSREYQVKAAFIYNFALFTEWPDSAFSDKNSPFVVAVIGPDPFGSFLSQTLTNKTIQGRPVILRHLDSADQISGVHLLFVPAEEDDHLDDIFKQVADQPILTVGESDKFLDAGGTIRFLLEDGRIRFEISPDSAARAGLRISSKLLSLAKIYQKQ